MYNDQNKMKKENKPMATLINILNMNLYFTLDKVDLGICPKLSFYSCLKVISDINHQNIFLVVLC